MKEISEAIKKNSDENLKELMARVQLKTKSRKILVSVLTTVTGLDTLLRHMDTASLSVLKIVYANPDGITFSQIQKELKIEIQAIEKIADTLSRNLLIYMTKNRQMLNTKQDKAYGISELSKLLNISDPNTIMERLHKNFLHLEMQKQNPDLVKSIKDREIKEFITFMAESGCIVSLDAAKEKLPPRAIDKILASLIHQNMITLCHAYKPEFNSFLILHEKISPAVAEMYDHADSRKHVTVRNRYFLLNNLLHGYDVISTFGLFLTKQMEFRKIDIRRIADSMLPLKDMEGSDLMPEELAQLSMFFLNRLKCLKLNKDIAGISLMDLKNELEQPLLLLKRVLKSADEPPAYDSSFGPPFDMPSYEFAKTIIKLLFKLKTVTYRYVQIALLAKALSEKDERSYTDSIMDVSDEMEQIGTGMNLLCVAGILDISEGKISLSDIGRDLANNILKTFTAPPVEPPTKSIYINPDFSLIIPAQELNSETLYHLMTHTDIIKHDFILNAVISRAAIVRAQKRGTSLTAFLKTLELNSKNSLPQNLDFLLREWSNQTIRVKISQAILMSTSHSEFIDELLLGIAKEGIVERISDTHALVRKEYIDEIIKIARKKDAVISLFNELDEEG